MPGRRWHWAWAGDELAELLAAVYQHTEARPEDLDVHKAELTDTVEKIQVEVAKGEAGSPNKIKHWPKTVGDIADDALEINCCLINPAADGVAVIHKVAEKAGQESDSPLGR